MPSVGEDDVGLEQVVDRQAVLAGEVTGASTERESADPRGRHDPERHREAERVRGMVHVPGRAAATDPDRARGRVDVDPAHRRSGRRPGRRPRRRARRRCGRRRGPPAVRRESRAQSTAAATSATSAHCGNGARLLVDHPVVERPCLVVVGSSACGRPGRAASWSSPSTVRSNMVSPSVVPPVGECVSTVGERYVPCRRSNARATEGSCPSVREEVRPWTCLSDVLLAVRLSGALFYDVDARSPFVAAEPRDRADRGAGHGRGRARHRVPRRDGGRVLDRAGRRSRQPRADRGRGDGDLPRRGRQHHGVGTRA